MGRLSEILNSISKKRKREIDEIRQLMESINALTEIYKRIERRYKKFDPETSDEETGESKERRNLLYYSMRADHQTIEKELKTLRHELKYKKMLFKFKLLHAYQLRVVTKNGVPIKICPFPFFEGEVDLCYAVILGGRKKIPAPLHPKLFNLDDLAVLDSKSKYFNPTRKTRVVSICDVLREKLIELFEGTMILQLDEDTFVCAEPKTLIYLEKIVEETFKNMREKAKVTIEKPTQKELEDFHFSAIRAAETGKDYVIQNVDEISRLFPYYLSFRRERRGRLRREAIVIRKVLDTTESIITLL